MRVRNPNAVSYRDLEPQQIYSIHENEKKLLYSKRVLDIELGTFTPLVFTTTGSSSSKFIKSPASGSSDLIYNNWKSNKNDL